MSGNAPIDLKELRWRLDYLSERATEYENRRSQNSGKLPRSDWWRLIGKLAIVSLMRVTARATAGTRSATSADTTMPEDVEPPPPSISRMSASVCLRSENQVEGRYHAMPSVMV